MLERGVRAQLEEEATGEADVARHPGADRPQRHATVEARVLRLIDRAEAVGVELAEEAVSADFLVTVGCSRARAVSVRGFLSHES